MSKDLRGRGAVWVFGGRAFQAEGTALAKTLRLERAWNVRRTGEDTAALRAE